jgi:hypothetical protein
MTIRAVDSHPHVEDPATPRGAWDYADRERVAEACERIIEVADASAARARNGKRNPPEWVCIGFEDCARDARIVLPALEVWRQELTGTAPAPFRPSHLQMLGYVALLLVGAWALNRPAPRVDLSTPCWAYNAVMVEHDIAPLACDEFGQFSVARDIRATIAELQNLQEPPP